MDIHTIRNIGWGGSEDVKEASNANDPRWIWIVR